MPTIIDQLAQVLMTMAGIAYGKPSAIPSYLAADTLTGGDWQPEWIANEISPPVNFAFIARSKSTGAYCIAIRGTYPNPFSAAYWQDASQDNPLQAMQPWPLGSADPYDTGPRISGGAAAGFGNLMALSNGNQSFEQAVGAIPRDAMVYVTGHSLGGTLAPVIGLWMTGLPNAIKPIVYCFAGLTPGNGAFASLFGPGTSLAGRVKRYKNTLDSVPYGWNDVLATRNFYQPAPSGGLLVESAITALALELHKYDYTPVGDEVVLAGTLNTETFGFEFAAFLIENLQQHLPDTYLRLLGAPSLPFTIGFGAVVIANDNPLAAQMDDIKMPVCYV
jgi:hypothetical protein